MTDFAELTSLPGTDRERSWLERRLTFLSEKEKYIVSAIIIGRQPASMAEAINQLLTIGDYEVCFPAGSYRELGEFYLRHEAKLPDNAFPYVDFEQFGWLYEDKHPGLFIGNCFVVYPSAPATQHYANQNDTIPEDNDWSLMVKLASPSVPEGVWLRLPDCSRINGGRPDEVAVVLDTLKVRSLESCVLLNAICSLPEAGNIMAQYSDPVELVNDGDDLGYVLDEQGQGMPNFMEKFFAALEYEGCRSLRFALDISQNLHCYEWVSRNNLKDFGKARLRESGVSPELIDSGYIDLDAYAADLLESEGYTLTNDKSAYIARNDKEFIYERSTPEEAGMTMQ